MNDRGMTILGLLRSVLLPMLLLYVAAVAFRMASFSEISTQADELHWVARSNLVLKNLKHGEIANVSTHLTHPGLPPAFVMASGQFLANRYNRVMGFSVGDSGFVDRLSASRLSNILLSSLLIPLVYFFASRVFNPWIALATALLLVLDPHHAGLSRQAHIDSGLTLFVATTVIAYMAAVHRGSARLKILAGLLWGAAVLTKPTALALLPFFVAYKFVRNRFVSVEEDSGERTLVSWSDVYAFLAGQFLLGLLYTRMWHHDSDYRIRLAVHSSIADAAYAAGLHMQAVWPLVLLPVLLLLGWIGYGSKTSRQQAWRPALLVASVLVFALTLVPAVVENLIRFWTWVAGLSGEKHKAYGTVWSPPEYGYLSLYVSQLPTVVLIGIFLSIVYLLLDYKAGSEESRVRKSIIVSVLALVALWTLPLSISSKQTLRYVVPVLPAIYLFAVYGFSRLMLSGLSRVAFSGSVSVAGALLIGFFLGYAKLSLAWAPDYDLYHNAVSGGLVEAVKRGRGIALAGVPDALAFLHEESIRRDRRLSVVVFGDAEVIKFSYAQKYRKPRLTFRSSYGTYDADMLIVFPQFKEALADSEFSRVAGESLKFRYKKAGAELLEVYEVPIPCYSPERDMHIPAVHQLRRTGRLLKFADIAPIVPDGFAGDFDAIQAVPGVDPRGYLLFGNALRFNPGTYTARFWLMLPPGAALDPGLTPERYVVRIELGRCQSVVVLKDLSDQAFLPMEVSCNFDAEVQAPLRAYWFGNVPVAVYGVRIHKEGKSNDPGD